MANTKIILSGQSDQNLVDPTIIRPVGIVPDDIAGLPAHLTDIEADVLKNQEDSTKADSDLRTKINADISDEAKARKAADAQIAQDLSDYGTSNDAALAAEANARIAADAGLQTAIDLEKGRLDVILSGSQVDLNQFKEVVEFIETIDLQNDEDLLGAVTSINVDITANKVAAEDAVAAEEAARIAAVAAEEARAKTAEGVLQDNIGAEGKRAMQVEGQIQTELDEYKSSNDDALEDEVKRATGVETALSAKTDEMIAQFTDQIREERQERIDGDDALDARITDTLFNDTPELDSVTDLVVGVNDAMVMNVQTFMPRRTTSNIDGYDSEEGILELINSYEPASFMFFINGLMVELGEDYEVLFEGEDEKGGIEYITLLGDAKTLADNGAKMVEYGVEFFGPDGRDISKVGPISFDEEGEGKSQDKRLPGVGYADWTAQAVESFAPNAEKAEGEGGE